MHTFAQATSKGKTMQPNEVKTQTFADKPSAQNGFDLKTMEELYLSNNGKPDKPHRHDYYTIIFIEKGEGKHIVDFAEYKVTNQTIYFIQPGQMHQLLLASKPKGYVVTFTESFLISNAIPDKLINDIYLFNDYGQSPPLPINDKELSIYLNIIQQIEHFATKLDTYTTEAVGSLVKLFLIQGNNSCTLRKEGNPQLIETSNHILRTFKRMLNENYSKTHKVSDYASYMAVTSDYLNKTVKSLTGKSAKEHIQAKLITEAKRALLFTDQSNKELAFALGFDESAHFNNFFKKITSQTPSEFRSGAKHT